MAHDYLEVGDPKQEVLVGVETKGVCSVAWHVGPFTRRKREEAMQWLRDEEYNFVFSVPRGQKRWLQKDDCFVIYCEDYPDGDIQCCEIPAEEKKKKTDERHPGGFHLMCDCNGTWYSCHTGQSGDCCP